MDAVTVFGGAATLSLIYAFYGFLLPKTLPHRTVLVGEPKPGETAIIRHPESKDGLVVTYYDDVTTLYELMKRSGEKYATRRFAGHRKLVKTIVEEKDVKVVVDGEEKIEKKKWFFYQMGPYEWQNYKQVYDTIVAAGAGLVSKEVGLKAGNSKLGIFANTCPEWFQVAHACFTQSIVVVTVYANLGEEGLVHAINEGELTHLFCNAELFPMLLKVQTKCPSLKQITFVDEPNKESLAKLSSVLKVHSWDELVQLGKSNPVSPVPPKPNDQAIIMYTSGTTDLPKGVMMSHANLVAAVSGAAHFIELNSDDVYIGYLPLAHVLELVIENFAAFWGIQIGYASPRTLSDTTVRNCKGDLRELSPTLMGGVPAVWERIRKGAYTRIEGGSPALRNIFKAAFAYKARLLKMGHATPLLDKFIFKKLRDQTGGRVRIMLSGGAPISRESHEFLRVCFGCTVIQGYGLTECTGVATLLNLDDYHYERVGAPIRSMEIKLVDVPDMKYLSTDKPNPRGEVWLRSAQITQGYFKNEKKTAEDYDSDGWFHTGDVGQLNYDGTISIIDRKKNLVKLSHGEYIALEKLEAKYKGSKYVENICVYADSQRDFPVALVIPVRAEMLNWAASKGLGDDFEKICASAEAKKMILDSLKDVGRREGLKSYESVQKVHVVSDEWTPENELITAAQKLKRIPINAKYKKEIEGLYQEK